MEYGCKHKVVLITGGTSGIGLAAARTFWQDGANVFLVGRDRTRGMQALAEIIGCNQRCRRNEERGMRSLEEYRAGYGERPGKAPLYLWGRDETGGLPDGGCHSRVLRVRPDRHPGEQRRHLSGKTDRTGYGG